MKNVAQEIRDLVTGAVGPLTGLHRGEVVKTESPGRWSKQEILGHLIDSATNNHQRFVRGVGGSAAQFPTYNQNEWVEVQRYNESSWDALVELWVAYNRHLCDVIERMPASAASSPCNIGRDEPVTLEFVVRDYLRHTRHHVDQLLG